MSSIINFNNFNSPSLNGLVDINADSVTTTNLESNDIQTQSLEVDGVDIGAQVNENKINLTGITYIATPTPTTKIVNDIDETGTIYIRDPSNPTTVYMRIYYEPSLFGFCFSQEVGGRIMNFRVKDNAGNYKLFYFSAGQLYANMGAYFDNWFNISYNNDLTLGDNNGSVWSGSRQKYIPNSAVTSGLVFYNKGLNNNTAYYTNFTHNDLSNVETATLRMNYANIWSKVAHIFESTINVTGTSTLATINGTSLYITGSSTFNNTITADSLSVVNASNFNGNVNIISTSSLIGTVTLIGNISANAMTITPIQLSYVSGATSNIQTQLNNRLQLTGGTMSGNLIINGSQTNYGNTNFYNDVYLQVASKLYANGSAITQSELSYLSGVTSSIQTQLNNRLSLTGGTMTGALTVNNTITTNNNITQTGTTAGTNRIVQSRILNDLNANPNVFKYSEFAYNSNGSAVVEPAIVCKETVSNNSMYFYPKLANGSYNAIVKTDDRGIFSYYPLDNNAITMTCWASTRVGVRICAPNSTSAYVDMWAKNCNLKIDSADNVSISGNNSTSSTPDLSISNNSTNGIAFYSNSTSGANNPFVNVNESVIGTRSQNNSSLVITTKNSALDYGIRLLSYSSTTATITTKVATNSIVMNQSNTTVSGPLIANGSTSLNGGVLLSTTTLLNNNILQYGSSIINQDMSGTYSGTNLLKITNISQNTSFSTTPALRLNDIFNDNSLMFFPNSGAGAFNTLNTLNCQSITARGSAYDSANFALTVWGTQKNGMKISTTGSANAQTELWAGNSSSIVLNNATGVSMTNTASITYSDSTVQTTAYTTAKDNILINIGSVTTSTLTATTTLTSGAFFNCGSVTLSAGTYILTLNCCAMVITGSTTIQQVLTSYSTSSTSLSHTDGLSIDYCLSNVYPIGAQKVMTSTTIVRPTSTTTYYMLCQVGFGSVGCMQFNNANSGFKAVRIA